MLLDQETKDFIKRNFVNLSIHEFAELFRFLDRKGEIDTNHRLLEGFCHQICIEIMQNKSLTLEDIGRFMDSAYFFFDIGRGLFSLLPWMFNVARRKEKHENKSISGSIA